MHRILFVTAAAFAAFAAPASADEQYEVRIVYGDLDLTTQSGADQMYQRIRAAARDTCRDDRSIMATRLLDRACEEDFVQRALSQLDQAEPLRTYARNERNRSVDMAAR